jgi:hypothetical protein
MTSGPGRYHTRHHRLLLALSVLAVGMLTVTSAAGAKHAKHHHKKPVHHGSGGTSGGWSWSKPYPLPSGPQVDSLSCATTKLCVATGVIGNPDNGSATDDVYWSTNPAGGTAAWQGAPLEAEIQPQLAGSEGELLDDASCEPAGVSVDCALVDGFDNLWQTGDPTGGAGAWGRSMPTEISFVALSCWSAWCGEIDVEGDAVVTVGAQETTDQNVFADSEGLSNEPGAISCNASAFCAAVNGDNHIAWTTNADGSPATWQTGVLNAKTAFVSIDCPSASLCLAVASQGNKAGIGVSTNPAGGAGTWKFVKFPGAIERISCVSASFCAATGSSGFYTSTNPASASASAWKKSKPPIASAYNLSCPTSTECVAGNDGDLAFGHR